MSPAHHRDGRHPARHATPGCTIATGIGTDAFDVRPGSELSQSTNAGRREGMIWIGQEEREEVDASRAAAPVDSGRIDANRRQSDATRRALATADKSRHTPAIAKRPTRHQPAGRQERRAQLPADADQHQHRQHHHGCIEAVDRQWPARSGELPAAADGQRGDEADAENQDVQRPPDRDAASRQGAPMDRHDARGQEDCADEQAVPA